MKYLVAILFIISANCLFAQKPDSLNLLMSVKTLDEALVKQDTIQLGRLLSNELTYGHSNGWVQTKREVIDDLYNGKLSYKNIKGSDKKVVLEGNIASVRMDAEVIAVMNGNVIQLKLKVLQVWIWKNKNWELFARQSVKM
jgi:hypothetical protein